MQDFYRQTVSKNSLNRLQYELIDRRFENNEDNNGSRVIKLSSDAEEYALFRSPTTYLLLLLFLLFFSNLSVSLFVLSHHSDAYFHNALTAHNLANTLQTKAPLLVNVYLSNLNRALEG